MPIDKGALATAGISAATGVAKGLIGSLMQNRENQKQRNYEQYMYNVNLSDQRKNWEMENMYNTPAMQMKRMKDAGLNPNLMYGAPQSGGNAGQIGAPSPNTSNSTKTVNPMEGIDPMGIMQGIYDMRLRDAQTNKTLEEAKTQQTVQVANTLKSELDAIRAERERVTTNFEKRTLDDRAETITQALRNTVLQGENIESSTRVNNANVLRTEADTQKIIDSNIREGIAQKWSIKETTARIAKIASDTKLSNAQTLQSDRNSAKAVYETAIQAYELEAAKRGYKLGDPGYQQLLKEMVDWIRKPVGKKPFIEPIKKPKSFINEK